jgi:hypothetical protein
MSELIPIEQKIVVLYDDELTAVRAGDGRIYVVLAHLCESLGIDTQGQSRRINRHAVLSRGLSWVDILSTQGNQTQRRRAQVLRVDLVPLWLSGIRATAVNEAIQPKLILFQENAGDVLWEAFQDGRLTVDPEFDELLQQDTEAVQAYKMLQALTKIAQNQVILESRLNSQQSQINNSIERIEAIENALGSGEKITPDQASNISQAVKGVAFAMGGKGKNYQVVYGELYRRYHIPTYRELPRAQYDDAMSWLGEWLERVNKQLN